MKRSNLLLIMVDQWRWDGLGKTGGWAHTPVLDRLADEGVLFDNCLTNSPVCIPARLSFATGLYPHNTGVWGNIRHDLALDADTWMKAIRDAGYRTCLIGKSHWHRHEGDLRERVSYMNAYGFDDVDEIPGPRRSMHVRCNMTEQWEKAGLWSEYTRDFEQRFAGKPYLAKPSVLPFEHYADVYVGQQAKRYLQSYDDTKPWLCMVSFGGPHEPWDAPEPYASMYAPEAMPQAIPRAPRTTPRPSGFLDRLYEPGNAHSPQATEEEIARMRANYAGNITLIDEQIGEIIQVLKDRGEWEHTAVVFVSDHGEMNGDHGLIYKENFYNSAVKVPLIVRLPETENTSQGGRRHSSMVEWFDVGPTLCELAGADLGGRFAQQFGKSLMDVLRQPDRVHREEALCEIHNELMIQTPEWKLAVNKDGEPYMLFHLAEDPDERENLIGHPEYAPALQALKDRLLQRLVASQTSPNHMKIT
ncbi:Multifunctional alkaline phosphatase superfamily protein PehA [Paenibacillus solanacearum]|uniref:Multifunctional alkaline phosphatase superfamily protein PehA n=1 Tax=Paenibacillus solanacearum TaxID=2048548 RepID=A0A916K692_9BACL|nr:sulfatase-like hydrolase/transferase [Paenibacillus solanacearum]CAG7647994.1 Multifunctional alkaline phosphatase superfamily protein PehA [Paenibacillus solanacearum]